jgi:decaprenylphospho-beta-D-erythro-pentofuranosid-2-ulose 2-reductase
VYLLILGANSEVARALAVKFAQEDKANLYLASRDEELLAKAARDLEIRCQVEARPLLFDALDYASHQEFYRRLDPKPDGVVVAFGYLGDQTRAQQDFGEARRIIETNFLGAVSILEIIAGDFERRSHGFIIGMGSVAGLRGRMSNYLYGAAKGGLAIYLGGLRHRLSKAGVRVMTVLPGFIQTKMTEGLDLPARLTARPEEVAEDIFRAYRQGKVVVYTKWFWKWIMLIIRNIPEKIFMRTRL